MTELLTELEREGAWRADGQRPVRGRAQRPTQRKPRALLTSHLDVDQFSQVGIVRIGRNALVDARVRLSGALNAQVSARADEEAAWLAAKRLLLLKRQLIAIGDCRRELFRSCERERDHRRRLGSAALLAGADMTAGAIDRNTRRQYDGRLG